MKILHINSYFSGSKFYKNLFDKQVESGLDISVFVPISSSDNIREDLGAYTNLSANHAKHDRLIFHLKHYKIYKDIVKSYDIKNYSVVHAHSLFSNGYIAMRLKKQYDVPYVVAVRNTDVNIFFKRMIHLRRVGVQILENADRIIFLSKSYRDEVIQKYIPEAQQERVLDKTTIIPNGIDDFWLKNKGKTITTPKKNDLKLLYVGVINKNKNITTTIETMKILLKEGVKVKLTVVGRVEDKFVYNQIKNLDCVEYIKPKFKEELLEIYRQNDVFVMPSIHESFGLVYAEAMSQGLPIIYTRGQGFDGQFDDGEVGYGVDPNDPANIAHFIMKIIDKYEIISKTALLGSEKFNWDNIERKYYEVYRRVSSG